ncbi:hypothetical protein [Pontibaca salina]|uniref:hypothetical protein n=1 Tax=Pontibaca salina TaxID=2795731 RepID=UPI0018E63859|nr:hypothetical protein [Pontibaca salina]
MDGSVNTQRFGGSRWVSGAAKSVEGQNLGKPKRINLTLAGRRYSRNLYSEGVDCFLDDEDIEVAAVSRASATMLNRPARWAGMIGGDLTQRRTV